MSTVETSAVAVKSTRISLREAAIGSVVRLYLKDEPNDATFSRVVVIGRGDDRAQNYMFLGGETTSLGDIWECEVIASSILEYMFLCSDRVTLVG